MAIHRSLNVARLANLPPELIAVAAERSRNLEEDTNAKELQRWCGLLFQQFTNFQERKGTTGGYSSWHGLANANRAVEKIKLRIYHRIDNLSLDLTYQ